MLPDYNSSETQERERLTCAAAQEVIWMLSPEAIIQQVWQKIVPSDWKIIRGKRRSALASGVTAAAWTGGLIVFLTMLAVAISAVIHASRLGKSWPSLNDIVAPGSATIAGYPALAVGGVAALALALLAGTIAAVMAARRNAGDPDPVIVLLPYGFVEYVSQREPIIGILYAQVAHINVSLQTRRHTWSNLSGDQLQTARRSRLWLALLYHDGHTERWKPRADFGPPERLFQTIIKAQWLYDILYGSGG
jgi:hypothetical protein